ncbi:hypothetical protein [Nocardia sp. GAS34]|uniref:hypothetical protein n=1 Tax=unclassified Nocardia TaxID=2637762 RepID=UPI003D1BA7D3
MTTPLLHTPPRGGGDSAATDSEVAAIIALARARGANTVILGSGRNPGAMAAMAAVAAEWEGIGGRIAARVTWPESAASWLRQARRFTATTPDLWIMTGPASGWAQMTRRLLWSTTWSPRNTLVMSGTGAPATLAAVGTAHLNGLTGVDPDCSTWTVSGDAKRSLRQGA